MHLKLEKPFLCAVLTLSVCLFQIAQAQLSTDPTLCGGYRRESRSFINFTFNENTSPPGDPTSNKFCMWTISPTVPREHDRYHLTIRNVNLTCNGDTGIAINFFNESSDVTNRMFQDNPVCIGPGDIWQKNNTFTTTMVVILRVNQVVYGQGFYMEWEDAADSIINPLHLRNTYYSFGRPSIDPLPYFAAGFFRNEISTFGFIKGNYSDGYQMIMTFTDVYHDYCNVTVNPCPGNSLTVFQVNNTGFLDNPVRYNANVSTDQPPLFSPNGFFIIARIQDAMYAGARFTMIYDTIRG